jgi:diacylglycerol kinase (ATP)
MIDAGSPMWALPGYGDHLEELSPGLRAGMKQMGAPGGFEDVVATILPREGGPARWSVTFAVDDVDAISARARELGGSVLAEPQNAHGCDSPSLPIRLARPSPPASSQRRTARRSPLAVRAVAWTVLRARPSACRRLPAVWTGSLPYIVRWVTLNPFLYVEVAVVSSLTIVVNPAAGGGRAIRHLPVVRTVLDAAGARYLICLSSSLGHARAIAAEAAGRGDLVVALGGDGMAGAVASAVAQAKPGGDGVFGVIAAGRGNDLARTYGIPLGPADAARLLLAGESRPMDLVALAGAGGSQVTVAGSVYLGIASAAGQIANDTRLIRGPLVYPVAALRALAGWEPVTFHVDAATSTATAGTVTAPQEFAGYGVVVANLPYFGAGMKVAPKADPGDGVLDIVLMRHAPKLTFLRVLTKIRKGAHIELDQIDTGRATAVTVTFDRPLRVGADGELFDLLSPLRISVLPEALCVIAPRVVTDLCTCSPPRGLTLLPLSDARTDGP